MKKNLILTGMMGVGKSTVGKNLSVKLNMNFIDTDKVVENNESMSISEIFEQKGEKYFRGVEKEICIASIKKRGCIIALGGGAFIDSDIREAVLNTCICFWLDIDVELLSKRLIESKKRPLLNNMNLKKKLIDIYEKRKKIYGLANYRIDCNKNSATSITKEITEIYETK